MKAVVTAGLTPVGPLLQAFFVDYLYGQKRASARTVKSYRDTFRLLLRFLQQTTGKAPSALHTLDLDAPVILFPGSTGVPKKQSATIAQRTTSSSALLFSNGGNPRSR